MRNRIFTGEFQTIMLKNPLVSLVSTAVVLVIMALALGVSWEKVQVWRGIMGDEVENVIDADIFGREKVLRKQAEMAIAQAQQDIERLQNIIVNSTVEAELLDERVAKLRAEETAAKRELAQLAELIEAGQSITTAEGQVWTVGDLQIRARTRVTQHQARLEQIDVYAASAALHRQTVSQAQSAVLVGQNNIVHMTGSLTLLDAKLDMLAVLRNAPAVTIVADPSLVQAAHEAEDVMRNLLEEVDREIRRQQMHNDIQMPQTPVMPTFQDEPDNALVDQLLELAGEAR